MPSLLMLNLFSAEIAMWKKLTFFGTLPVIAFAHYMAFRPYFNPYPGEDPHARPDFVPYEYLRIRTKVSS